ncbi:MAG: hypothetical protein IPM77_08750 [Crocinitomicaceae bacterium]|nr:hypothetical protein [Crocinitomicaceae bacterium]
MFAARYFLFTFLMIASLHAVSQKHKEFYPNGNLKETGKYKKMFRLKPGFFIMKTVQNMLKVFM